MIPFGLSAAARFIYFTYTYALDMLKCYVLSTCFISILKQVYVLLSCIRMTTLINQVIFCQYVGFPSSALVENPRPKQNLSI